MIRVIGRYQDFAGLGVGGSVVTEWQTWRVDAPEIEAWLRYKKTYNGQVMVNQDMVREIVGVELEPTAEEARK